MEERAFGTLMQEITSSNLLYAGISWQFLLQSLHCYAEALAHFPEVSGINIRVLFIPLTPKVCPPRKTSTDTNYIISSGNHPVTTEFSTPTINTSSNGE